MNTAIAERPAANPYVSGNQAPVRIESTLEPKVRGKIPDGLHGASYRNGPNPQFDPGPSYHAFLGDGMIHGIWIEEGRARRAYAGQRLGRRISTDR